MLYDRATIHVEAGGGGNGCVSFRREAHVPKGGPDGGDGGRRRRRRAASPTPTCATCRRSATSATSRPERGGHGEGSQRHGARGDDARAARPVRDGRRGPRARRCTPRPDRAPAARVVVARGGGRGPGNRRFATSTRQAPRFAEHGRARGGGDARAAPEAARRRRPRGAAERRQVVAAAAPHARPARRSPTIRSRRSSRRSARSRTTTGRQLVLADIPGLIEGARGGRRARPRVPRARRADAACSCTSSTSRRSTASDPWDAFETVRAELERYGAGLEERPFVVVLSKIDLLPADGRRAAVAAWRELLAGDAHVRQGDDGPVVIAGLDAPPAPVWTAVRGTIFRWCRRRPTSESARRGGRRSPSTRSTGPRASRVRRRAHRRARRSGSRARRSSGSSERHDLENPEALAYIEERLKAMGVDQGARGRRASSPATRSRSATSRSPSIPGFRRNSDGR